MPPPSEGKLLVRRSNLLVPLAGGSAGWLSAWSRTHRGNEGWNSHPDAVTLDLEDGVPAAQKEEARARVRESIPLAARGASEVFVRVNAPYLYADLEASAWPGLSGILLPRVERAADVAAASEILEEMERRRGIQAGSLEVIVLLGSALGVWNSREIVTSSPRVTQAALAEGDLCLDLGVFPSGEYDPLEYARGRLIIEGTAAGVQPLGIAHPLGAIPAEAGREEVARLAADGRNLGFKGVLCPYASWIEPVNTAFTPTPQRVEYYTQVREVFAQAVAAGTAAVPFAGRMIDVPVDEWAKVVLRQAAACRARDEQKQRALEREG
jgi:citrate lyase subunit beta/citryl-CoA lyase